MENGSAKGDAKLSYEDSSAAPAAVEWFNGKEYKGKVSVCVSVCALWGIQISISTSVPFLVITTMHCLQPSSFSFIDNMAIPFVCCLFGARLAHPGALGRHGLWRRTGRRALDGSLVLDVRLLVIGWLWCIRIARHWLVRIRFLRQRWQRRSRL